MSRPKTMEIKTAQKCSEGNTRLLSKKTRLQCFTSFAETAPIWDESKMNYLAYGKEICPTTNKHHWQGFVYWKNGHTIKSTSKWFNNAHVEHCIGSLESNEKYCSKEGEYTTFGEKPKQGKRTDLIEIKDKLLDGSLSVIEIRATEPIVYHQYGRLLERLEDDRLLTLRRSWRTEGFWFWGKTNTGKTHHAVGTHDLNDIYFWTAEDGKWFDGYIGQSVVILDDFRGELQYQTLLKMCDKWPFSVPRRGRSPYPFLAKRVYVTAPCRPEHYYVCNDKDSIDQLLRRFIVKGF